MYFHYCYKIITIPFAVLPRPSGHKKAPADVSIRRGFLSCFGGSSAVLGLGPQVFPQGLDLPCAAQQLLVGHPQHILTVWGFGYRWAE